MEHAPAPASRSGHTAEVAAPARRVAPGLLDELRDLARRGGLDAVGVAAAAPFLDARRHLEERKAAGLHGGMHFTYGNPARSTDPQSALPGARSVLVGARSYRRAEPGEDAGHRRRTSGGPGRADPERVGGSPRARVARYAWRDHYAPLRAALGAVAERLEADGWRARVLVDDNALVDREAAYRAGIGWYGKNANILLPGRGSWFVLGSVVTDAPLPPAAAPRADGCGPCTRCLPACPTGALVAPGVLDARRCLAHLVQAPGPFPRAYREALGDRLYGCDDCQTVCPVNRADDRRRRPPPPAEPDAEPWVPVLDVLAASDDELLARFGRWYVPRRQPRYLRRNALVVLGNVGDGAEPAVAAAVEGALRDPDPLMRAHAVWAARRLGRDDLVARALAGEDDAEILAELAAPVAPRAPSTTATAATREPAHADVPRR